MNILYGIKNEASNRLALQVIKLHEFSENSKKKLILESIAFLMIASLSILIIFETYYLLGSSILIMASYFLTRSFCRTHKANIIVSDALNETATFLHLLKIGQTKEPEALKAAYNGFVYNFKKTNPDLTALIVLELL
ncbi:MAG: hypothetical protein ACEPOZ_15450 [Marinifilaceae bacterium]|jgi:uncharacterized membrane protein YqjE